MSLQGLSMISTRPPIRHPRCCSTVVTGYYTITHGKSRYVASLSESTASRTRAVAASSESSLSCQSE
jgi:hypothetical protein